MGSVYLDRYAWPNRLFPEFRGPENLSLIIVIPCFREPDLIGSLDALNACEAIHGQALIIVIVNEAEKAVREVVKANQKTLKQLSKYESKIPLLYSHQKLPAKKAGVGLARKIGMDEATRIFRGVGNDGAIVCFDADCRCDVNFLDRIEFAYSQPETMAGIAFYEHQLHGKHHVEIVNYELYLRYYIQALRYAGFPYAHQTLGSCINVRTSMYEKVGGMNTRKAGEDFYFLNKTIPHEGFVEINDTTVRPSDRLSNRVPFGTGKAIQVQLDSEEDYHVYHPNTFEDLRIFFSKIDEFWKSNYWKIPLTVKTFLGEDWEEQIKGLKNQVASREVFVKRFFHWFDAFHILKFVHFARDEFYPNVQLEDALDWLCEQQFLIKGSKESYLVQMRYRDRGIEKQKNTNRSI